MQHATFNCTHYGAGYQYGAGLLERGIFIPRLAPFPLTEERRRLAAACLGVCRAHFPAILEEMRGLADGQGCPEDAIQTILFSMYTSPAPVRCSCFAVSGPCGPLLGRNSDFLPHMEEHNLNAVYRLTGSSAAFTGNTTAFIELEDGVNSHGLAVGLTSVPSTEAAPGLNAGLLLRYFLENCRNTSEVILALRRIPIASAQTFTVADRSVDIAVIECSPSGCEVIRPEHGCVCAVNAFHSPSMRRLNAAGADNWRSGERYAAMECALRASRERGNAFSMELLSGKYGFMCQYDRAAGQDTVWSVVYDLAHRLIYRAEGNPARVPFEQDLRFTWAPGSARGC